MLAASSWKRRLGINISLASMLTCCTNENELWYSIDLALSSSLCYNRSLIAVKDWRGARYKEEAECTNAGFSLDREEQLDTLDTIMLMSFGCRWRHHRRGRIGGGSSLGGGSGSGCIGWLL